MMATNSLTSEHGSVHLSLLAAGGRLWSQSGASAREHQFLPGMVPPQLWGSCSFPCTSGRCHWQRGWRITLVFWNRSLPKPPKRIIIYRQRDENMKYVRGARGGRAAYCQAVISVWSSYDLNSHLSSALAVYDVNRTPKWNYSLLIHSGVAFLHRVIYAAGRNCTIRGVSLKQSLS